MNIMQNMQNRESENQYIFKMKFHYINQLNTKKPY